MALEEYFEQGRRRCYSLRKYLEQFSAPAPSGDADMEKSKKMIDIINKRKSTFYKKAQTKNNNF